MTLVVRHEIRRARQRHDACAALLRRLVELEPNNLRATNELALLLLRRGDVRGALRLARNAVRIAPAPSPII